jgi:hypothetical protein
VPTINDLGSFCDFQSVPSLNQCHFSVPANGSIPLPNPSFKYCQGSVSFNHKVSCGATHAEVSANNPSWYDVEDVSVVDGFNNKVELDSTSAEDGTQKLGPPAGKTGNRLLFGVFPSACTTCDAINNPPCGSLGPKECHPVGPSPPRQYQMNPATGRSRSFCGLELYPSPPTTLAGESSLKQARPGTSDNSQTRGCF